MRFSELLKEYIGYKTLEEVSRQCEARGIKVSPSYLSRMRTGDRPAPDDEVAVRVIAEVCEQDPQPLVLLAQIERRPYEAISYLIKQAVQINSGLRQVASNSLELVAKIIGQLEAGISPEEILADKSQMEALCEFSQAIVEEDKRLDRLVNMAQPGLSSNLSGAVATNFRMTVGRGLPVKMPEEALLIQLAEQSGVPAVLLRDSIATLKRVASVLTPDQRESLHQQELANRAQTRGMMDMNALPTPQAKEEDLDGQSPQ